ncbi:MAG: FtsX-like permease family protein [Bacteroidia bacterium]
MNIERFVAKRIISGKNNDSQLSRPIVRISVIGIALGLTVMILTVCIVTGFQNEIRDKLIGFGSHIQITNYDNNISDEPQPISRIQPSIEALKNNRSINHIQVYATKSGIIKTKTDNEGVLLKGVGADYDWKFIAENLKEGTVFKPNNKGVSKSILISKYLANKLELKLNDKMVIYFLTKKVADTNVQYEQRVKTFYISGIYETGFEDIDKTLVLVDIAQIQKLNYWDEEQVGGFEISIKDYSKIDEIGAEVNDSIGQGLVAQTVKEINPTIFSWLQLQDMNAIIVITLMVLVAGINMISALLILILERTSMIGILKALGARNKIIQKIFLMNATYLIGKGLFWGNVIGLSIAFFQYHFGVFKLDQATYYVSVIPIEISWLQILLLNIGTLVCCLLMLIIPSFIVSKITPVKSIRFS